jgi:metallophosphoesterase (TIGR00282 family)
MKVLFVGDVVADAGRKMLKRHLPSLKQKYRADLTIVNGENSAQGNGMLPASAEEIFSSGADVITGGNHTFRRHEIGDYLDTHEYAIRPYNCLNPDAEGNGYVIYDMGKYQACIINLIGNAYLEGYSNVFYAIDELLSKIKQKIIIIDFHAEATAEKYAMAHYLDGRVSALIGTHTHVRTADAQIFPNGLGFLCDAGMTGPKFSVLGVDPEKAIRRMKSSTPVRFETAQGECILSAVYLEIDDKTGKTTHIESFDITDDANNR